ncbi:MAG: DUF4834 family protein [Muribaculum sp.]|nr:DUF4834 family protein [Muribaculum sp.]
MSFLLTCLFIYLLFLLLRPFFGWAMRKFLNYQARRIFGQAWSGAQTAGRRDGKSRRAASQNAPKRKKVFERGYGEYVEFEEIKEVRVDSSGEVKYTREEQVSDAEWVEIK